jgi:hypothetical protein
MTCQHEARGADQTITSAIDDHVQAEQRGDDDDGLVGAPVPVSQLHVSCTGDQQAPGNDQGQLTSRDAAGVRA